MATKNLRRTVLKTFTYKLIATAELAAITYCVTGNLSAASHVGAAHLVFSTLTYAGFDHIFDSLWAV